MGDESQVMKYTKEEQQRMVEVLKELTARLQDMRTSKGPPTPPQLRHQVVHSIWDYSRFVSQVLDHSEINDAVNAELKVRLRLLEAEAEYVMHFMDH